MKKRLSFYGVVSIIGIIVILLFGIIMMIISRYQGDVGQYQEPYSYYEVKKEACKEVKSYVYKEWGEIPEVLASVKYVNGKDYIVIVKYSVDFRGMDIRNSVACHIVAGYSYYYLSGMTNELSYEYEYDLEELKVLWKID